MELYQHIPIGGNTEELTRTNKVRNYQDIWVPQISSTIPNHQSHRATQMPKEQGLLMKVHVRP